VARIPILSPSYLDGCDHLGYTRGDRRWRSKDGTRHYTWDALHGEIEVSNPRGRHIGVADPVTGDIIEGVVNGRRIQA
jgi:hypothetical protein